MKLEVGTQYVLSESFAFCGLGWETGTVLTCTALDVPHLPRYCMAMGGSQNIDLATPIELLQPLQQRRRRRTQAPPEPIRRRRRRSG